MTVFLLLSLVIFIVAMSCLYRQAQRNGKRSEKWIGMAFAVSLPLLTLLGYLTIGSPQAIRLATQGELSTPINSSTPDATQPTLSDEQIQNAITALEAETLDNPRDINKLIMLANSYALGQRFAESATIWDNIVKIDSSADTLLRAADAHTFANQGAVTATAQTLIDRALQLVPQHPQGLWMAGMSAVQQGSLEQGKDFWQKLYPLLNSQPEQQQELAALINELDTELAKYQTTNQQATETPSDTNITAPTTNKASITVNVSLDPEIIDQVSPSDTVFVFARAVKGPPAPLAAKRLSVSDLPTTVELTEQDAMVPQMTITTFSTIKISAKVSKSGNPTIREGDINSAEIVLESLDGIGEQTLVIGQ